jgi:hypothetical protein
MSESKMVQFSNIVNAYNTLAAPFAIVRNEEQLSSAIAEAFKKTVEMECDGEFKVMMEGREIVGLYELVDLSFRGPQLIECDLSVISEIVEAFDRRLGTLDVERGDYDGIVPMLTEKLSKELEDLVGLPISVKFCRFNYTFDTTIEYLKG